MSPISPDILRAVEIIDQRIASLRTIREMLVQEFSLENGSGRGETTPAIKPQKKKTRREAIVEFLRINGPHKRVEIEEKTGIPRGTVATILNDHETFGNENGKWRLLAE